MKVSYVRRRLDEIGKDPDWLADQSGVSSITMKQNYMRGMTPKKPVAINFKRLLQCNFADFLHHDEIVALGLQAHIDEAV